MKRKLILPLAIIVLLLLLAHMRGLAQETKSLTLNEAVDLGIKNSKQLKGSKAKIDEATAVLNEATDRQLPDLSVSGSYLRVNNPDISLKTGGSKSSDTSGSSGSGFPSVNSAMYGLVTASYTIYSGNRIKYGIESARYLREASLLDSAHDRGEVVINIVGAYINLYKAKAAVKLVRENLEESRQRDTDFTNLENNGVIARNDLLKAELETSNVELSLLDAENNWKLANVNMNLLLGLPEATVLDLDSTSLSYPTQVKTAEEYEQSGLQNRKDIAALGMRNKAAGVNIQSVKGGMYPSIALTGGYAAIDIPGFVSVLNAVDIGVGVKYDIGSLWKTKSKLQEAKAKQDEIVANTEMLDDNMRYQVNQAYENYLLTLKKIDVYARAIIQAEENYKITKNKYNNTLATTTDLLDADVALLQAKLNHTFAKADAVVAYNRLIQAAGLLTDKPSNN